MIHCLYLHILSQDAIFIIKKIRHVVLQSLVMTYGHIDVKFYGGISNSIFLVIHKAFAAFILLPGYRILEIQVMWKEVLHDSSFHTRNVRAFYIPSLSSESHFLLSLQTCLFLLQQRLLITSGE